MAVHDRLQRLFGDLTDVGDDLLGDAVVEAGVDLDEPAVGGDGQAVALAGEEIPGPDSRDDLAELERIGAAGQRILVIVSHGEPPRQIGRRRAPRAPRRSR
jgi:hypothetical protein